MGLAARLTQQLGARVSADAAVAVLQWFRERYGDAVRPALYDAAIAACAVNFAPEAALKVFAAMREAGARGTTRALNMLIAACTQAGYADLALEVWLRACSLSLMGFFCVYVLSKARAGAKMRACRRMS